MTVYRTTKGSLIDIAPIIEQNSHKVAAGNTRMNAKGDELGKGGAIIRTTKKKAQASHNAAKEVRSVGLSSGNKANEEIIDKQTVKKEKDSVAKPAKAKDQKKMKEIELEDGSIEMVEDFKDE